MKVTESCCKADLEQDFTSDDKLENNVIWKWYKEKVKKGKWKKWKKVNLKSEYGKK